MPNQPEGVLGLPCHWCRKPSPCHKDCKSDSKAKRDAARREGLEDEERAAAERQRKADGGLLSNVASKGSSNAAAVTSGAVSMSDGIASGGSSTTALDSCRAPSRAPSLPIEAPRKGDEGIPTNKIARSKNTMPSGSGLATQLGTGVLISGLPSSAGTAGLSSRGLSSNARKEGRTNHQKWDAIMAAGLKGGKEAARYGDSFSGKPGGKSSGPDWKREPA